MDYSIKLQSVPPLDDEVIMFIWSITRYRIISIMMDSVSNTWNLYLPAASKDPAGKC